MSTEHGRALGAWDASRTEWISHNTRYRLWKRHDDLDPSRLRYGMMGARCESCLERSYATAIGFEEVLKDMNADERAQHEDYLIDRLIARLEQILGSHVCPQRVHAALCELPPEIPGGAMPVLL